MNFIIRTCLTKTGYMSRCNRFNHCVTKECLSVHRNQNNIGQEEFFVMNDNKEMKELIKLRGLYPEFIPSGNFEYRDRTKELLERKDMLERRKHLKIPEFYVGSKMSVSFADKFSPSGVNTFVGICITRIEHGLNHQFSIRNVVENHGVEINFHLYNPLIQSIKVLVLEKRLDDDLTYLRDCDPIHSTVPFDLPVETRPPGVSVPVNDIKLKLKDLPWTRRWELRELRGAILPTLPPYFDRQKERTFQNWRRYDIMEDYRTNVPPAEQYAILSQVARDVEN
ncbi:39S ribosomal protein L19, mitochondrial [Intoshia linei]|uniref:Large ribosomal subunit protein bL19m n=1 Tax=Intoshia linei TaxID=1819745 RepID=A0A177BDV8_9BILA|nr:39S ribosomal protein L19, mitochondrial [Intoshia linei]